MNDELDYRPEVGDPQAYVNRQRRQLRNMDEDILAIERVQRRFARVMGVMTGVFVGLAVATECGEAGATALMAFATYWFIDTLGRRSVGRRQSARDILTALLQFEILSGPSDTIFADGVRVPTEDLSDDPSEQAVWQAPMPLQPERN